MTRPAIPTFAIVGAVNHGKSSIVAALAEDDGVRVSSMPGETVVNQRFDMGDLLVLYDTPGFQNARKALADLAEHETHGISLEAFGRFIDRHRADAAFDAECRLLQPIVDGAGIFYVVDGSRPLRDIHLVEMEILRLTGAPRLAIINRSGDGQHLAAWKSRLDQHFNLVRSFDSHHVTSADRIDLLESLASIERPWKEPLRKAVRAIEAARDRRVSDAAALIADLVTRCLQHVERDRIDASSSEVDRQAQATRLRRRYMDAIATMEHDVHRRIIALHAHHRVEPDMTGLAGFETDLFADETWQLFGLGTRQLMGLSTLAGGLAGAGVDAATLGHSLGVATAIGAATGAGSAYLLGRKRPELALRWPTGALPAFMWAASRKHALRLAGGDLAVGPYQAENFPWILIDRAQCLFAYVHTRSHALRDDAVVQGASLQAVVDALGLAVRSWSDASRAVCQRVFKATRAAAPGDAASTALRDAIAASLQRIVDHERPIADAIR